ncbi:MAG: molybdopterin molybdotransferase MoeA [Deltaproteobacteria bacterium]|nr:molybdopterin molybdotransferase MoeA [Deltaproteobacteria bacterium]
MTRLRSERYVLLQMISVREALDTILADVQPLGRERVALLQARSRSLAESVHATRNVPPFRNSAMDGYAVRADDIATADGDHSIRLRVLEVVAAGDVPTRAVEAGTATKIMTGALMPEGADAVVRVEDTAERDGVVTVQRGVKPGTNVRHPGEDMRLGDEVLSAGRILEPADIGLLASLGNATVLVRRRPEAAILATGDELVELGEPLAAGQIANSNAYTLAAAVEEAGAVPRILGIVRDTPETMHSAFSDAFRSDVVLSTGGVSMGTFDLVRGTLRDLGCVERFWKVAQKPGKPLSFNVRGSTPVFGLPGNPVSALVCFYLYVRPTLRAMLGIPQLHLPVVDAQLADDVKTSEGLTDFVRGVLEPNADGYRARVTGTQSSGALRSMSLGQGLIVSPPEMRILSRGSTVRVIKLGEESSIDAPF